MEKKDSVLCELVIMEPVSGFLENAELVGQLDALEWSEVAAVAEVLAAAIERQLDAKEGSVGIQKVISAGPDGLRQRIRIVRHGDAFETDSEILDDLAIKVARALRGQGGGNQGVLEEGGRGGGDVSGGGEIADLLKKKGGRPIRHPIQVLVAGRPSAELTGRFGAQPIEELVDDSPQMTRVVIDEIGYSRRYVKAFKVKNYCRTRELIELQFREAQLPALAAAIVSQIAVNIEYANRLDAKGKIFVELLEISQVAEGEYSLR
ncbi:MAG: hypothetical protein CVU18_11355 [Betaproteobacteria bacterium HGW-Betaproteobacteria-12]|nr:MAG: hypothetical protein CVU18_11355 [Betaproteobacteria bacterium HGW-Betaproteobacteria-12]